MASSLAKCGNCRYALIEAFIASTGLSIRSVTKPRQFTTPIKLLHTSQTKISIPVASNAKSDPPLRGSPDRDQAVLGEAEPVENGENGPDDDTSIPWYLQVEPFTRDANPLLKRQQLPELPPEPPPLLRPMLEHISTDLGLDDLTLFDLRDIDPPPALGANLIMVLGTARSEKHLHVSADRFCRWLKTTHKLSPYADGLIGRGELKLKLRRKARRARLLSNVGSSEQPNVDDGIRTGWICVSVGDGPDGRNDMIHQDLHDDYVGFGEEIDGVKMVIQMLTQEKREELDLEGLWSKMVRRQERKEARISPKIDEQTPTEEVGPQIHLQNPVVSDSYLQSLSSARKPLGSSSQIRYSHSSTAASAVIGDKHYQDSPQSGFLSPQSLDEGDDDIREPPGYLEQDREEFLEENSAYKSKEKNLSLSDDERLAALQDLADRLKTIPHAKARKLLNEESSSFWRSFNDIDSLFPTIKVCELRLNVLSYAHDIGANSGKNTIIQLQREIEASFIDIPKSIYLTTVKAVLQPPVSPSDLLEAATVLEYMSARGHSIAGEEIRSLVQFAILQLPPDSNEFKLRQDAFQRFRRLMNNRLSQAPVEVEIKLMEACAATANWEAFWDVWRGFARAIRPRPRELYTAMFHCTAQRNHQAEAMRCLRECVPEMAIEEPPVTMDSEIAKAVKSCLFIAEPEIEKIAADSDAFGEWASLWRRCNRAILSSAPDQSSTRKVGGVIGRC